MLSLDPFVSMAQHAKAGKNLVLFLLNMTQQQMHEQYLLEEAAKRLWQSEKKNKKYQKTSFKVMNYGMGASKDFVARTLSNSSMDGCSRLHFRCTCWMLCSKWQQSTIHRRLAIKRLPRRKCQVLVHTLDTLQQITPERATHLRNDGYEHAGDRFEDPHQQTGKLNTFPSEIFLCSCKQSFA